MSSTRGGATPLSSELAAKQQELEGLFALIDAAQEEFDALYAQASAAKLELEKLQRENGITQKVKLARQLESTGHGSLKKRVDESMFSGEHYDYIKQKRDVIEHLRQELEQVRNETNPIEEEVNGLQEDIAILRHREMHYKSKLERREFERRELQHQVTLVKDMLKEAGADVKSHESIARDAQIALTGLKARKAILDDQIDADSEMAHNLKNLDSEISIVADRVLALDDELEKLREDKGEYEHSANVEMEGNKTTANWHADEAHMRGECDRVKQDMTSAEQELKDILARIKEKEARFEKLAPIARKWKARLRGETTPVSNESVDKLLRMCNKNLTNSTKLIKTRGSRLETLALENSRLECMINSKREQLYRDLQQFERDKAQMRTLVLQKRSSSFDLEHQLLGQIAQLRLRVAQKRQA